MEVSGCEHELLGVFGVESEYFACHVNEGTEDSSVDGTAHARGFVAECDFRRIGDGEREGVGGN